MGSSQEVSCPFEQWQQFSRTPAKTVLLQRSTGRLVQKYLLKIIDEKEFQSRNKLWQARQRCGPNVIRILLIEPHKQSNLCNQSFEVCLYCEHLTSTLKDYRSIPFSEALFILIKALDGFRDLCREFKVSFRVGLEMVGFTSCNEVKVWHCEDVLEEIGPGLKRGLAEGEESMVKSILALLLDITEVPSDFQPIFDSQIKTFAKAKFALEDYDARHYKAEAG